MLNNTKEKFDINKNLEIIEIIKETEKRMVFLGLDPSTEEKILIKQFRGSGSIYETLTSIEHRNLPEILGVSEEKGVVTVWERYIEGTSLEEYLQNQLCTPMKMQEYILQILDGLEELHRRQIIHRDIKPKNIILGRDGNVYLIDFDAARTFKENAEGDTLHLGTEGYAAPEQYGTGQTDARTDIYAVGVLMNQMLTGKFPAEQLYQEDYKEVIERCIQVNREQRFVNVDELRKALISVPKKKRQEKRNARLLLLLLCCSFIFAAATWLENRHNKKLEKEAWERKVKAEEERIYCEENVRRIQEQYKTVCREVLVRNAVIKADEEEKKKKEEEKRRQEEEKRMQAEMERQREEAEFPKVRKDGKVLQEYDWETIYQETCSRLQKKYPNLEFYYSVEEMRDNNYSTNSFSYNISMDKTYVNASSVSQNNRYMVDTIYEIALEYYDGFEENAVSELKAIAFSVDVHSGFDADFTIYFNAN